MSRINVSIIYGQNPNFREDAFKYFILYLNRVQTTYEFFFPDVDYYIFQEGDVTFQTANLISKEFIKKHDISADYHIMIITGSFDNNFFFNADKDTSVITTDIWDSFFSPPSLFEYLMHCIYTCLLYSSKGKIDSNPLKISGPSNIKLGSHRETRGCIADFTRNKFDDRVDITLGYICASHQNMIKDIFGEEYLSELKFILDRKWIGDQETKGSAAYNLKHVFKFDINKDSGFNKTLWEKCQSKFYEIPGDVIKEVIKIVLTSIVTYFLVKYGIEK